MPPPVDILKEKSFTSRVSSVLNRNGSMFGKKFMFDNDESTCWNSDQGKPQWVRLEFEDKIAFNTFHIQFQGGFVGTNCLIETSSADEEIYSEPFYPENNNSLQTFQMSKRNRCNSIRFLFNDSFDTYGRIVIYKLSIFDTL